MTHLPDLTFLSAMLAGFLSSGHCIAMCGAIALAGHQQPGRRSGISLASYHAGRLFSYTLIGALAGGTGGLLLSQACSDEVMATWPRIAANSALLVIAVCMLFGWRGLERMARPFLPLWRRLMPLAQRLRNTPGPGAGFTFGMLWGWIPCGLIYAVAFTAAISGSAVTGATLLLGFGIGTLPALLGGSLLVTQGSEKLLHNRQLIALSILGISVWQLLGANLSLITW